MERKRRASSCAESPRKRQSSPKNLQEPPSPFSKQHLSFEKFVEGQIVSNENLESESLALYHRPDCQQQPYWADKANSISQWISSFSNQELEMEGSPSKRSRPGSRSQSRSRSSGSPGQRQSEIIEGTESTFSRDNKFLAYRDGNYSTVLETKGIYMRPSTARPVDQDLKLCKRLVYEHRPEPIYAMLDDRYFETFQTRLQGRSESRVYLDLHPLLVPSAEHLWIRGELDHDILLDGHNDAWVKALPICGPRPQPDHFVGLSWQAFSEEDRRKLEIEPTAKSYFTAREDIYFPFLTCEIKCGNQALELANKANAHSIAVAMQGIIELYRRAGIMSDLHGRVLGFSISHDDQTARIFCHYVEIDGDQWKCYRDEVEHILIKGEKKMLCQQFVRNLYAEFVPIHLERIKHGLAKLIGPTQCIQSGLLDNEENPQDSTLSNPTSPLSQDLPSVRRPVQRQGRGLNAELRSMIQSLQQQLEQQRQDAKRQEERLMAQLEQQRQDAKQQEERLMAQLKQSETKEERLLNQLSKQTQIEERLLAQLQGPPPVARK